MPTTLTWAGAAPAIAEIYLGFAICTLLMIEVFAGAKRRGLTHNLTLLALGVGIVLLFLFGRVDHRTVLFHGMYVADALAFVLKVASFVFTAFTLLYSRTYLEERGLMRGEYHVLVLTALLGICVLCSANSLLTVYIGVELLALSIYAMVAMDRDNGIATESAMKYFVLGCIASGVLVYGMSMVYGMTGTLSLQVLAGQLHHHINAGVIIGLAFIVAAAGFKIGAAPFHMWLPDVYEGAPTSATLFMGTVPKIAYFALILRLLTYGLQGTAIEWTHMLAALAVLTLVVGYTVAIVQTNLKRMLAYSTIGNVGFILLGFVAGTPGGYGAALYYTLAYILVALGSFGVILLASRKGFEADELEHYKGLQARDPLLALVMLALMFSTAGVPPFIGFWAKLSIIQQLWSTSHDVLIVIAVAMTVVGCFYYLRVIKLMYFDAPADLPATHRHRGARFALSLNGLAVIVLGILPAPLLDLCTRLLH